LLAIEAHALTKTYGRAVRALDGLSFAVEEGIVFGLLGPNGAGKSTAVRILATLSRPDSGSARVAGVDVLADPGAARRRLGYVAQASGVDLEATGRENLELQGRLFGLGGAALRARVDELLAVLSLGDAADRLARTYSGGMRRRLDVAMGLVNRPRVLFLDEPTTGLDPEARTAMWSEVRHLAERDGITVLLTTHYLEEADRLVGRLAIVDQGRVVAEGRPDELKAALRGDTLVVELADDAAPNGLGRLAAERAASVVGVGEVRLEGTVLRARAADGARTLPAVLSALDAAGVPVASVAVHRPSLDDVYLQFAGRDFASADAAGSQPDGSRPAER
jgi:ABC-2 type transport system ATP-binding protein